MPPAGVHRLIHIYDRKNGCLVRPGRTARSQRPESCTEDSLLWALKTAPSYSLVVYDGVVMPYYAIGEFQNNPLIGYQPLLLPDSNCRVLVKEGYLESCKPFTTMAEFVKISEMERYDG